MTDESDSKKGTTSFTVDHENSGVVTMPSVTKLLNRKKLGLSKPLAPAAPPRAMTPPPLPVVESVPALPTLESPPETALTPEPATSPPGFAVDLQPPTPPNETAPPGDSGSPGEIALSFDDPNGGLQVETRESAPCKTKTVRVQVAKQRAERRSTTRIILWDAKQLKAGPDPLGRGLSMMMDKGVSQSLFLTITAGPSGSPVPHFVASAAVAPQARLRLWSGMKWDPTVVPELWNLFVRSGCVELGPPGGQTNVKSNRNVVRAAFGVSTSEWLLLVRAGPANSCRGVLALISEKSLLTEINEALPQISAPAPANAKKAA